jgi:hypothetical protein
VTIYDESYILSLPCNNITFYFTFIKPFYILDNKLVEVKELEPERDIKNESDDIIIVNTSTLINALKYSKGQPYKAFDVIIFL